MPRKQKPRVCHNYSDISVKDYADTKKTKSKGRLRKSVGNGIQLEAANGEYEPLDDIMDLTTKKLRKKKTTTDTAVGDDHNYNYFPDEVWFMISEHIQPEDVTRFALICKQTYNITTTFEFWKNLYRRFYRKDVELPLRLQPICTNRPRGMRAYAIRSIFFTYLPFVDRLKIQSQQDFHSLVKRRLVQFWFQRVNAEKLLYFYKLKRKLPPESRPYESEQLQRRNNRSKKAIQDVYCNAEEGCTLLVIETTQLHPLPEMEMIEYGTNVVLSSIVNRLSRSCSHYRLEMEFRNISCTKVGSVVYEPAISIRVYDWWTPTYAKYVSHGTESAVEYLRDETDLNDNNRDDVDDSWDNVIYNF